MRVLFAILLLLTPLTCASTLAATNCGQETWQIKSFAKTEAKILAQALREAKSEIIILPAIERVRAEILWVEADTSRKELESYLEQTELTHLGCAFVNEDIRARLFHAQEFADQLLSPITTGQ